MFCVLRQQFLCIFLFLLCLNYLNQLNWLLTNDLSRFCNHIAQSRKNKMFSKLKYCNFWKPARNGKKTESANKNRSRGVGFRSFFPTKQTKPVFMELSSCDHKGVLCAFNQQHLFTMQLVLLSALVCLIPSVLSEGSCVDHFDCSVDECYGSALKVCAKTCDDCDGAKYEKFFKVFDSTSCEDAYPTKVCEDWKNSEGGQAECDNKKGSVSIGCRKTCGNCQDAEATAKPSKWSQARPWHCRQEVWLGVPDACLEINQLSEVL